MAAFHVFLVDEEDEEAEEDEKIKEEIINEESAEDPLLITAEEGKENTYRALIELTIISDGETHKVVFRDRYRHNLKECNLSFPLMKADSLLIRIIEVVLSTYL